MPWHASRACCRSDQKLLLASGCSGHAGRLRKLDDMCATTQVTTHLLKMTPLHCAVNAKSNKCVKLVRFKFPCAFARRCLTRRENAVFVFLLNFGSKLCAHDARGFSL